MSELDHMFELDQCNLSYFNSGRCLPESLKRFQILSIWI